MWFEGLRGVFACKAPLFGAIALDVRREPDGLRNAIVKFDR